MPKITNVKLEIPKTQTAWAVLYCRALVLFIFQGIMIEILHAISGWNTPRGNFPIGFRLDPRHGILHLVTGIIATYIGFGPPSEKAAVRFTQGFGIFYLLLAVFGTFTKYHFGLELGFSENAIHWILGGYSALIGFGPGIISAIRGKTTPERSAS
jgi:hypothetical protein